MPTPRHRKSPFGQYQDRICAVVAAGTAPEMIRQVRIGLKETRTIELRLDWLKSDSERKRMLRWVARNRGNRAQFLATCRRTEGGGLLKGDASAELYWLIEARKAGCAWCDIEMETIRELPDESLREYAVPPKILLSMHDFDRTPEFPKVLNHAAHGEVDALKIAARARSIKDSVRLLELARRSKDLVAVPMGEVGLPARILALRYGSALEYAPVEVATAPGQVGLHDLKYLYRAHRLTEKTEVYGVIANPVSHSLSPLMHNTGYVAAKRDAVYLPFLVEKLPDFLETIPELGIRGFSVTIPHKQTILKYLDECEPLAEKIGAVNTVVVGRNGKLFGCNTDYVGVLRALERKMKLHGSRVVILGAGGSARAAAFALAESGAEVSVCARREAPAKELAKAIGGSAIARRALRKEKFDAIVNTTPVGMYPNDLESPLVPEELNCKLVMDLIYRPMETKLLQLARRKGIATVSGVDMFVAQGAAQWEIWTKTRAPEQVMRKAVVGFLQKREKH